MSPFADGRHLPAKMRSTWTVPITRPPRYHRFNTGVLILSSVALQYAQVAARRGRKEGVGDGLFVGGLFAFTFLFGQLVAWRQLNAAVRTHQGKGRNMMHRRNMLSISAITALGLALMPGSAVSQQKSLKDQLVGAWTLVSIDNILPDGKKQQLFGANPNGILIFDVSGRFAQVQMPANRPKFKSANRLEATAEESTAAMHT